MKFIVLSLGLILAAVTTPIATANTESSSSSSRVLIAGVPAVVVKKTDHRLKLLSEAEDQYYLQVNFGRLRETDFHALRQAYGNLSQVIYDANREYDLIDFLAPAMQAVANQVFLPKKYETEWIWDHEIDDDSALVMYAMRKQGVSSFTNCWNTTIEMLRMMRPDGQKDSTVQLYWPGRWTAQETLYEDAAGSAVNERDLRAGDVLLVGQKPPVLQAHMLQHSAILLSPELVFEKTDSTENDPYRIAFRRDVEAKYRRYFEGADYEIKYRRFSEKAKFARAVKIVKDDVSKKDRAAIKKQMPDLDVDSLAIGCETGMGGGCDMVPSPVFEAKVITNPKTGRGILFAPRSLLDRFQPLR